MVDEIVVGFEDAVREPVVAHKLPEVFDRVELGAFWRQRNDGDVGRHDEAPRQVPASLMSLVAGNTGPCWWTRTMHVSIICTAASWSALNAFMIGSHTPALRQ